MKISARNTFAGTITAISNGPISTEVTIKIAPKIEIVSVITTLSMKTITRNLLTSAIVASSLVAVMAQAPAG